MSRLQLRPEFHRAIKALKLVELASKLLSIRPIRRTLPGGSRYRVRYGESLLMADEIFQRHVYQDPFVDRTVKTFIDLGSNVGYFTCYAADRIGRDALGLAVNANPKMAEETKWHIDQNGWPRVKGLWAVVGYPSDMGEAPFFLNPSNISGSATVLNPNIPAKGEQTEITGDDRDPASPRPHLAMPARPHPRVDGASCPGGSPRAIVDAARARPR